MDPHFKRWKKLISIDLWLPPMREVAYLARLDDNPAFNLEGHIRILEKECLQRVWSVPF